MRLIQRSFLAETMADQGGGGRMEPPTEEQVLEFRSNRNPRFRVGGFGAGDFTLTPEQLALV